MFSCIKEIKNHVNYELTLLNSIDVIIIFQVFLKYQNTH